MGCCCRVATFIFLAFVSFLGYNVYKMFQIPPIPNISLNQYWGPGQPKDNVDTSIRPFKVEFEPAMVIDLKERLANTRTLTKPLEGIGFEYGFNSNYLQEVLQFWRLKYDFTAREKYLNSFPQFVTNIQGLEIHFLHVKPNNPKKLRVVPLLLLHGWPGSVVEFYKMIPLLVAPRAGQDFVFEVIAPSLPGYGYSQGASKPGLGDVQIAVVMKNLMDRLNFKRFVIQGGDWGSLIGSHMAVLFPDNIIGYHSNFAMTSTAWSNLEYLIGAIYPPLIVSKEFEDKIYPLSSLFSKVMVESGYFHIQSTKPDTVGTALLDSPAGLAAYILEKFSFWTNPKYTSLKDGGIVKKFTMTELLDNLMVYWDSQSIVTSVRLYAESINIKQMNLGMDFIPTPVPTAIARFPNEMFFATESQHKTKYPNLLQLSDFAEGGHFAAFEVPDVLAKDLWTATQKFLEFSKKKNSKSEL